MVYHLGKKIVATFIPSRIAPTVAKSKKRNGKRADIGTPLLKGKKQPLKIM
jgi:hypothetical protein